MIIWSVWQLWIFFSVCVFEYKTKNSYIVAHFHYIFIIYFHFQICLLFLLFCSFPFSILVHHLSFLYWTTKIVVFYIILYFACCVVSSTPFVAWFDYWVGLFLGPLKKGNISKHCTILVVSWRWLHNSFSSSVWTLLSHLFFFLFHSRSLSLPAFVCEDEWTESQQQSLRSVSCILRLYCSELQLQKKQSLFLSFFFFLTPHTAKNATPNTSPLAWFLLIFSHIHNTKFSCFRSEVCLTIAVTHLKTQTFAFPLLLLVLHLHLHYPPLKSNSKSNTFGYSQMWSKL